MAQGTGQLRFVSRTEAAFYRWGKFVARHRLVAILAPVLLSAYMVTFLPQLTIDNSTDAMLHPDDPAQIQYDRFRSEFDRDDRIIVALAPDDVFDPSFLAKLRGFHLAIEAEVPYVDDITSLLNARSTRAEGDELIVEDLLEGWRDAWPREASAFSGLRERVLANPLYVDALISADAELTTLSLKPFTYSASAELDVLGGFGESDAGAPEPELLSQAESHEQLVALYAVIDRFEGADFPVYLAGPSPISDYINTSLGRDIGVFMGICSIVVLMILYVLFRRIAGALLPMMVVLLSVVVSVGIMIALEIPANTAVQILPVFLLTVGVCDAVHILTITYRRIDAGDAKDEAIAYAIGHSGLAVLMTSLTTAAGMASFYSAKMASIAQLGTIAPIGVFLALVYTLVLLPALLALIPLRPSKSARSEEGGLAGLLVRRLVALGDFVTLHPRAVVAGAAIFVALSAYAATYARFAHYALDWFPDGTPVKDASLMLDERLRGTMSLEVVVDSGVANGLHDPAVLRRMDEFMRWAEQIDQGDLFIGKAVSIVDIVKETHQALNEDRPEFRTLPDDRALIAQELLLFENGGADDLEEFVDADFSRARISLRAPFVDAMLYGPFMLHVASGADEILGSELEYELTGFMPVLAGVVSAVVVSMARSYAIALVVITPLMILLLRNLKLGLLAMIPNLIPVVFVLGVMGLFDMPLDGTTIMIGAMVIGLAVDDTIHFMHKFRIYFAETGDARQAVRETLSSTGAALFFTTLVLTSGFSVLTLASMVNTQNFGILAALATIVAFAADVIVAPALMVLATRSDSRTARSSRASGL